MGYVNSENVRVYPTAYRGQTQPTEQGQRPQLYNPESRLNTEANITRYYTVLASYETNRKSKGSFVISKSADNKTFEFVIYGYYFKITLDAVPQGALYACIDVQPLNTEGAEDITSYPADSLITIEPDNNAVINEVLDDGNNFTGLYLTSDADEIDSHPEWKTLQLWEGTKVPTLSYIKYTSEEILGSHQSDSAHKSLKEYLHTGDIEIDSSLKVDYTSDINVALYADSTKLTSIVDELTLKGKESTKVESDEIVKIINNNSQIVLDASGDDYDEGINILSDHILISTQEAGSGDIEIDSIGEVAINSEDVINLDALRTINITANSGVSISADTGPVSITASDDQLTIGAQETAVLESNSEDVVIRATNGDIYLTAKTGTGKITLSASELNANLSANIGALNTDYINAASSNGMVISGGHTAITFLDAPNINANSSTITAQTFNALSDVRTKENIADYNYVNSILDLPVKEFDYKSTGVHTIGCIAQDLQKLYPELVTKCADGMLAIQENKLVYLLLEEVKKLRKEIDELNK